MGQHEILEILKINPLKTYSILDLSEIIGCNKRAITVSVRKLIKYNLVNVTYVKDNIRGSPPRQLIQHNGVV